MNSFRMRYYYMAPLLVLAMVACAKRDNNFAKKAGEAKAAQQKAGQPTPTPSPTGKDTADTSVTTNPDGTKKTEEKDKSSAVANAYKGDLEQTYADSCENKLAMEVNKDDKEEEIQLKDIITKEKGSYVLKSTDLFAERTDKDSKILNQMVLAGSSFDLPKDFKDTAQGQAVMVNCHTINLADDSSQTMIGELVVPYEISTVDGAIKVLRFDKVELKNKNQSTALTVLKAKEGNLTNLVEKEAEGRKVLLLKHSDSSDITIRIQKSIKDEKTGSVMKKTFSATYSLKK
ncbi:MAG: hypothetical protein JSU04_06290 [Bdellovibrionales bacterium]|nr:hypothetical protein [Bdellovibrionales bacterium]